MPGSTLPSIPSYSYARRAPIHGIPATRGTACHMCPELSCIRTGRTLEPWRFYCDRMHRKLRPMAGRCQAEGARPATVRREAFCTWLTRRMAEEGLDAAGLSAAIREEIGSTLTPQQIGGLMTGSKSPRLGTRMKVYAALGRWPGETMRDAGRKR